MNMRMSAREVVYDRHGALHMLPIIRNDTWQRIPRVVHQTHEPEFDSLSTGIQHAALTWAKLNPEYTYVYYSASARRAYVREHASRVPNFSLAFGSVDSGTARCDLWRALIIAFEGGVYADMDSLPVRPLREIVQPHDHAVSGVGHEHRGLEQWLLVYAARHPVLLRYVSNAVRTVVERRGGHIGKDAMIVTGPRQLHLAFCTVMSVPTSFYLNSSSHRRELWDGSNAKSRITILPGR